MTIKGKALTDASTFIVKNPRAGQIIGVIVASVGVCAVLAGGGIIWISTDILKSM